MNVKNPLHAKAITAALIVIIPIIGYIDYITGYEFGFFVLYFIPIAIASWLFGIRYAAFFSVASAIVWVLSDRYSGHTYDHVLYLVWNAIIRLLAFLLIGLFLSRIHILLAEERKFTGDLNRALNEIKTLSELLPICAWCKRVRDDKGYWQQLEEYVKTHTEVQFSHGLCQDCAAKMLDEEMHAATSEPVNTSEDKEKPKLD
ncbi:MAG: hypothetical protein WC333_05080 [Dehalococcoidia bacterium]|jgi:hypothetical protein